MKTSAVGALAILAALGSWAAAQYEYWGGAYVDNRASTPAEGYARGLADVIRSRGMANLANSEAAVNMTEAARRDIENREKWTDTYFQMRKKNREYRAEMRGPRPTQEDFVRLAAAGKPDPLSPSELDSVTGEISWPRALTRPEFDEYRKKLDELFARRAAYGETSWEEYRQITSTIDAMEKQLVDLVRDIPPGDYTNAKSFIKSLDYEVKQPAK